MLALISCCVFNPWLSEPWLHGISVPEGFPFSCEGLSQFQSLFKFCCVCLTLVSLELCRSDSDQMQLGTALRSTDSGVRHAWARVPALASVWPCASNITSFFSKRFTYLFQNGGGTEGERDSQADSTLSTEPKAGLELMTLRPRLEPKPSQVLNQQSHPRAPVT